MILSVTDFSTYKYYQPKNISFTGAPSLRVKEIKNLPDLICPRCGGPIIAPQDLIDVYRKITQPLKYMLQKGYMDKSKGMPVMWEYLNSLAEKHPDLSLDKIFEDEEEHERFRVLVENIVCPGINRDNRIVYNAYKTKFDNLESGIRKSSRRELVKSPAVLKNIKPFIKYLREIEQTEPFKAEVRSKIDAFEFLSHYSLLYPDKTLSEIINTSEIRSHIMSMKEKKSDEFQEWYNKIFDNFRDVILENTDSSEMLINGVIYSAKLALFRSSKDPGIRLANSLKVCKSFTEQNNCPEIYDKLASLIKQINEIPFNKYIELSNYIGEQNDGKIVEGLIKQYTGSSDHFKARAKGGMDLRQNKVSLHRGCNKKCGDVGKDEMCFIYPRFPENTCKQVNQVSEYIYNDYMISKYYLYPLQAAHNIREESNGIINPDVSGYLKRILNRTYENADNHSQQLNEAICLRDEKIIKLSKTVDQNEILVLRAEIKEINKQIQALKNQLNDERRILGALIKYEEEMEAAK